MNLDFILFRGPKVKYKFIDLWGQTIFIPCYSSLLQSEAVKKNFLSEFTNCYKASKTNQVYFSIDYALKDAQGLTFQQAQKSISMTQDTRQEQLIDYYIPCLFLSSMVNSKYIILYFHSAGEDIKIAHSLLNFIRNSYQVNVLAMEYPGYSLYAGSATSTLVNKDAKTVYDYIVDKLGFQEKNIIILGRSIGTGVALELLGSLQYENSGNLNKRKPKPRALALISPFASVKNLAKQHMGKFGTLIAKEQYNNTQNIQRVECPVFIVHGKKDALISFQNSKQLMHKCNSQKLLVTPEQMTHSTFDFYMDLIDPLRQFLFQDGVNFYQQNMQGPTLPQQLFQLPEEFPI